MAEIRGPKVGDSASLWNFTVVPGWNHEEVAILKLALMKFGVGRWKEITESGCLPGKLIQQLNGQTQRLLGQQSLAGFTGLCVDVDKVRADNILKTGPEVVRKAGLIINSGGTLSKQEREELKKEYQKKYGLSSSEVAAVQLPSVGAREAVTALGAVPQRPSTWKKSTAATTPDEGRRRAREPRTLAPQARKRLLKRMLTALTTKPLAQINLEELPRPEKLVLLLCLRRRLGPLHKENDENEDFANPPAKVVVVVTNKKRCAAKESEGAGAGAKGAKKARKKIQQEDEEEEEYMKVDKEQAAPAAQPKSRPSRRTSGSRRAATVAASEEMEAGDDGGNENLNQLLTMGFSKQKARDALAENGGHLERAVDWLFASMA